MAAGLTLLVVRNSAQDEVTVPGDVSVSVPAPTLEPAVIVPPTVPPTVPDNTTATASQGMVDSLVIASDTGVTVTAADGPVRVVTTEPMSAAVLLDDGRVVMQRPIDSTLPADQAAYVRRPLLTDDGTGGLIELETPDELQRPLRLHDATALFGRQFLLVEAGPLAQCQGRGTRCTATIYLWAIDSGTLIEVATNDAWEGGWGRLSVSATGVVLGTAYNSVTGSPFAWALDPSATEATPTTLPASAALDLAALGLEPDYSDCFSCPDSFAIGKSGEVVGWVERLENGTAVLNIATIDDSTISRIAITELPIPAPKLSNLDLSGVQIADGSPVGLVAVQVVDTNFVPGPWYVVDVATGVATPVSGASEGSMVGFG